MPDSAPFARTVIVTTLAGLFIVGQMYVVIPLLPAMAVSWGAGPATLTWATTAFGLAYAGGFLLTGPLSDRYGRRRVITVGLAALSVATAAVPMMPNLSTGLAARAVQGLAAAAYSPAALAYLTERVAPRRRPVALTCLITAMVAAAVVGQLYGQFAAARLGWRGVFLASAVTVAALGFALRAVLLPDRPSSGDGVAGAFAAMGRLVARPLLALVYVAALAVLSAFVAVYTALQLLGPAELTGDPGAMLALRASALPALVAVPLLAPVLDRVRPTLRAAVAMTLAALVAAALAAGPRAVPAIALLLLVFVGALTAVSPGLSGLVGTLAGPARGAGLALYTFALLLGASLGPQLVAVLHGAGLAVVLLVVGGVLVAGAALLVAADRRLRATPLPQPPVEAVATRR